MPKIFITVFTLLIGLTSQGLFCETLEIFEVRLELSREQAKYSIFPQFKVSVTNKSNKAQRILNVQNRPDLHGTYCQIRIESVDRNLEFGYAFSDPNIVEDSDYIILSPNETIDFTIESEQSLPENVDLKGSYRAYAAYYVDLIRVYKSNYITFNMSNGKWVQDKNGRGSVH